MWPKNTVDFWYGVRMSIALAPSLVAQSHCGYMSNNGRCAKTTIRRRLVDLRQVGMQPGQLLLADQAVRVGYVVERDEVHALVVEAVVARRRRTLVRLAVVEARIVLARNEADVLDLQLADDGLNSLHAALALRVVGGVREIAGEDDEVGLVGQAVDRDDRLFERMLGVGIGRALVAPVGVRDLDEVEVAGRLGRRLVAREQACSECDPGHAGELEEVATVDRFHMNLQRIVGRQYRNCGDIFPPE